MDTEFLSPYIYGNRMGVIGSDSDFPIQWSEGLIDDKGDLALCAGH